LAKEPFDSENDVKTLYDMERMVRMQLRRALERRIFFYLSITLLGRGKSDIFLVPVFPGAK